MAKRVYFAFHYQDVIDFRANVVRNHNALTDAQKAGYFDASIWEAAKKTSDMALKRMINSEMKNTSIEIGNSLIGIHINSVKGKDGRTKTSGPNPFDYLGLQISDDGKTGSPTVWTGTKWVYFSKHDSFTIKQMPEAQRGKNFKLSKWFSTKDWVANNGIQNFSNWIS